MKKFLDIWLFYFSLAAVGWSSLAGIGFILALAFVGDSSPGIHEYAKDMFRVFLVLFVYPCLLLAVLSAPITCIHLFMQHLRSACGRSAKPSDRSATHCSNGQGLTPSRNREKKFPIFRVIGCIVVMLFGLAIIVANGSRTLDESGIVPTVIAALVFFVPLVLLPGALACRLIKRNTKS